MLKNKYKLMIAVLAIIAVITAITIFNINNTNNSVTKIEGAIDIDNSDLKINWDRYKTVDINLKETFTISESGNYHITGSLDDGAIEINAGVGEVRLLLDNVFISNSAGPAIICHSAEDLVIELIGNNVISDGSTYDNTYDKDIDGVIYSKSDLTFQGEGTLNIIANYQDGIVGKDDLKFNGGNYYIATADDGIRGKDSVHIVSGSFTINSRADAIKSTNDTDNGKGFIMIESGTLNITAGAKAIKATNSILFYDGELNIDSHDDAIHSNNYVGIINGDIVINSGDDGIHADKELIIEDGNITINKSYEGLEAQAISINGGNIKIVASDDGLNAGGGADNSANNRPGANPFDADTSCNLAISGGNIYIDASGDGIDSNGYLNFSGGSVVVDGPTNNGNGALDAGAGIKMTGGTVIAIGASGMAEAIGTDSTVNNVSIYFDNVQPANTTVEIKNSAGEVIISHFSPKTFNHMTIGTDLFKLNETYTILINETEYESFTILDTFTVVGNNSMNRHTPPDMNQPTRR